MKTPRTFEQWLKLARKEERDGARCTFRDGKREVEARLVRSPSALGWMWSVLFTERPLRERSAGLRGSLAS